MGADRMTKDKRRRSKIEVALAGILLAGACVCLVVYVRGREHMPVANIPTPVLPSPIGYDYFVQAGTKVVIMPPMSYAIPNKSPGPAYYRDPGVQRASAKAMRINAPAVKLLRQGLQHPCQSPRL